MESNREEPNMIAIFRYCFFNFSFLFCIGFVDWFMIGSAYSYCSSNYCDSDSCCSFLILKAKVKENSSLLPLRATYIKGNKGKK